MTTDKPCCYGHCHQGRDCVQHLESRLQSRVLAVALAIVLCLVLATILV